MAKELVTQLRKYMDDFGVMDEFASDGATVYTRADVQEFLAKFGIKHRVSSAYNPHSNQRAEGAVKAPRECSKTVLDPTAPSALTSS